MSRGSSNSSDAEATSGPAQQFVQFADLIAELREIWANDADFGASLNVICRYARQLLETDGAYALISEAEHLRVLAASGCEAEQLLNLALPVSDELQSPLQVLRSGKPEVDSAHDGHGPFHAGLLLSEPVVIGQDTVGVLVFARRDASRPFGALEQAQAAVLARQAGFSYRMRRRARELHLIYEVTRAINSSLKVEEVLEFIYQGISRILPTDNFYIALYEADSSQIRFEIEIENRQRLPKRARAEAAGLSEYLLHTRKPLLIDYDFIGNCERLGIRFSGRAARSWLGAPMVFRDKAVGVIALQSYEGEGIFDAGHLSVLENVASQAAIAIENARLYQQTRASLDQLQTAQQLLLQSEKLAAVGQLISGIAHELNNPLTGVVGWTQYLMGQPVSGSVARHLTTINEQAQRAAKIVQNLLTFSRQHKPEQKMVAINDIIESTLALRAYELRVNNIAVERKYSSTLPMIAADSHQLQQVILNLIINAEQAILSTRGTGTITVETALHENMVRFSVADDGPGISPDMVKKIFDPFFTTKPIGQGTGLGLSISFGIIQEHGGRIWAESENDGGARFVIELPVTAVAQPAPAETPEVRPVAPHRQRILVVDDEESVRELLMTVLEDESIAIETAGTGEEGFNKASRTSYDLILTDLKMPGLSGSQFYEKLQEARSGDTPRFVFMTGDVLSSETQAFLESTNSCCMLKPFDITEARSTVMKALLASAAAR